MSEANYCTKNGDPTTADDPERLLWYAASGHCGYWTDDWNRLSRLGNIPCCPVCGCVGMQIEAADWFAIPEEFEQENPGYSPFLVETKEACGRDGELDWMGRYRRWAEEREAT